MCLFSYLISLFIFVGGCWSLVLGSYSRMFCMSHHQNSVWSRFHHQISFHFSNFQLSEPFSVKWFRNSARFQFWVLNIQFSYLGIFRKRLFKGKPVYCLCYLLVEPLSLQCCDHTLRLFCLSLEELNFQKFEHLELRSVCVFWLGLESLRSRKLFLYFYDLW